MSDSEVTVLHSIHADPKKIGKTEVVDRRKAEELVRGRTAKIVDTDETKAVDADGKKTSAKASTGAEPAKTGTETAAKPTGK